MDSFWNEEDTENTNTIMSEAKKKKKKTIMSISLQVASITYVIQQ